MVDLSETTQTFLTAQMNDEAITRVIFERQRTAMVLLSEDKKSLHFNTKFSDLLGYTREELHAMPWREIVFSEDREAQDEAYAHLQKGTIDESELKLRFIHKNGQSIITRILVSCIRKDANIIAYLLLFLEPSSRSKETEDALKRVNLKLEKRLIERTSRLEEAISTSQINEIRLHRNKQLLEETQAKLNAIISTLPDLIWMKDPQGRYLTCNPAFEDYCGKTLDEIVGKSDDDLFTPDGVTTCRESDQKALKANDVSITQETLIFGHDGSKGVLEVRKVPVYNASGQLQGIMGIGRDITQRLKQERRLHENEQTFRSLTENSPDVVVRYDRELKRIYANPAWEKINGIAVDEIIGKTPVERSSRIAPIAQSYEAHLKKVLLTGEKAELDITWLDEAGKTVYYDQNAVPEFDQEGLVQSVLTISRDVTVQKALQDSLRAREREFRSLAENAPNIILRYDLDRLLAKDRVEQAIASAEQNDTKMALLFIDLDGFKTIDDTMGHALGDHMLKSVTERLLHDFRVSDTLSRQGGDEFLLILSDVCDQVEIINITEKILEAFNRPFQVGEYSLSVSASIGIAVYPQHGSTFESLQKSADMAMYKVKEKGKDGYLFFDEQMRHEMIGTLKLQNDLKAAFENREFILHYQPQIDLESHSLIGVEALIRWRHPRLGIIPPVSFISVTESNGMIAQIGAWVIEEACKQAAHWHQKGICVTMAVNVSAVQFRRGDLSSIIEQALKTTGLDARYLELELTESVLIDDAENVLKEIERLKDLGIGLSIDDFGTGYSSLAYLKRFAVNKLKIDRSFIRDILNDKEDATIVRTIIQMAKNLDLKTIAEGVEEEEIMDLVHKYGCDEAQGHHIAQPMQASDFELFHTQYCNQIII